MRVIALGTGGPRPDPHRNAACTVVDVGGEYLVFDTGRGIVQSFARKPLAFADVAALFITHHHYDHVGEFADFMISSWLDGRRGRLPVFGPPGTARIYSLFLEQIYDRDLEFRTQGERAIGEFAHGEVTEVRAGPVYETGRWRVSCAEMLHGHGLFGPSFRARWVCLGYRIEAQGRTVSISGDGVRSDALVRLARGADLHVQCCYLPASALTTPQLKGLAEHTLACSDTAGRIAAEAGVKRLVLTHFRSMTPAMLAEVERDVRRDFDGPVALARDLDEFDVL
jgi:ribonuclease BN (tRNA processing enzyme)